MKDFFIFWLVSGILAYLCGRLVDKIIFKEKNPAHIYCIICGPLLWLIVFNALINGIIYAIKKKRRIK